MLVSYYTLGWQRRGRGELGFTQVKESSFGLSAFSEVRLPPLSPGSRLGGSILFTETESWPLGDSECSLKPTDEMELDYMQAAMYANSCERERQAEQDAEEAEAIAKGMTVEEFLAAKAFKV